MLLVPTFVVVRNARTSTGRPGVKRSVLSVPFLLYTWAKSSSDNARTAVVVEDTEPAVTPVWYGVVSKTAPLAEACTPSVSRESVADTTGAPTPPTVALVTSDRLLPETLTVTTAPS